MGGNPMRATQSGLKRLSRTSQAAAQETFLNTRACGRSLPTVGLEPGSEAANKRCNLVGVSVRCIREFVNSIHGVLAGTPG